MSYWSLTNSDSARVSRWVDLDSNGNINDVWGNNHGMWVGTPAGSVAPPGTDGGNGYYFNGSNYIDLAGTNIDLTAATLIAHAYATNNISYAGVLTSREVVHGTSWATLWLNNRRPHYQWDSGPTQADQWGWNPGLYADYYDWDLIAAAIDSSGVSVYSGGEIVDRVFAHGAGKFHFGASAIGNDKQYWSDRRFQGSLYDIRLYSRRLSFAELEEIRLGPEPTYAGGASLGLVGNQFSLDLGNWNDYSNGSLTYQWKICRGANNEITEQSGSGKTGSLAVSPIYPEIYRLRARVSNNGGYDEGDTGDGWYTVAEAIGASASKPVFWVPF